jgi:hypothetical protein
MLAFRMASFRSPFAAAGACPVVLPVVWSAVRRRAVLAAFALGPGVVGAPLAAQQPPAAPEPVLVAPGDSTLRSGRLTADTARFALIAYRGTQQQQIGSVIDVIRFEMRGDVPVIHRVLTVQRGMAALVDSTITDARTMAPRSHRTVQPQRRIALEFTGRRVKGSLGPIDVPSLPIDTTLAVAPFDSGNWDLLVRTMPLAKGYAARFRVYDTDSGLREYRIAVTGTATVGGEAAHVVIFTLAPGRESVVWISTTSGRVLQVETMIDAETMLRQVRQR